MGEFYLQRKLFNRTKRTKTQEAPISPTCSSEQVANEDNQPSGATNQPEVVDQMDEFTENTRRAGSSRSMGQIAGAAMIRQVSNETSSSSTEDISISALGSLATETMTPRSNNERHKFGRQAKSKFRSASRAISLLRRAASSLTSSSSTSSGLHRFTSNGLASSTRIRVERQNTDSSQSQNSSNGVRPSSSAGSSTCTAGKEVPQFIVPKMGALRLPLVCRIKSQDGELMREVFVHRYELGQYLIENLKVSVGIKDCKYFGLRIAKNFEDQEDLRNPWLDLNESVCKQLKNIKLTTSTSNQSSASQTNASAPRDDSQAKQQPQPGPTNSSRQRSIDFYLRIKFYPPNMARVQDSFLRNYLWLQLRRDLRLGKLTSSMNNLTQLMACVLQYELGDCAPDLIGRVPELNILQNQDLIEEQAIEVWRSRLAGLKRHQAQMQFLRAAVILETYGFDYYPVRDHQRQRAYLLGFNYAGVKTIRNGRIVHHFRWHSISKISHERRMIIFHIYPNENSKRKQVLGFKCLTNEDCQNLYLRLLEQNYFFTVDLAYFDKSIRRPSYLHGSPSDGQLNWISARGVTSAGEPLAGAATFSAHQLPDSGAANRNHLLEHEQMADEFGDERSDTSSLIHQDQPITCSTRLQDYRRSSSNFRPMNHCTMMNTVPRQDGVCQCAPIASNDSGSQTNRCGQVANLVPTQPAHLGRWSHATDAGIEGASARWLQQDQHSVVSLSSGNQAFAGDDQSRDSALGVAVSGGSNLFNANLESEVPSTRAGSIKPQLLSEKILNFIDWALTKPGTIRLQNKFVADGHSIAATFEGGATNSIRKWPMTISDAQQMLALAFKCCLLIMVMNLLIRLADNCSSALIELLTLARPVSSSNPADRDNVQLGSTQSMQNRETNAAISWNSMQN